jgi:methylthioribose-1-phosphate isomerase
MVQQTLEAIKYAPGKLEVLDQLLLPFETKYVEIRDHKDGHTAIQLMQVRGAPAIAIVAALSLAVELTNLDHEVASSVDALEYIRRKLNYLKSWHD